MTNFIVFEGLDGCGKTKISQLVAEKLGYTWLKTPPIELSSIRINVDLLQDELLRFYYYMIGNMLVSNQVDQLQMKNTSIVCDRYIESTLTYFHFFGLNIDFYKWRNNLKEPDIKIFLDVSYEKRMERLSLRDNNTIFDEQTKSIESHEGLRSLYLKNSDWLIIETEKFSDRIDEEVDWIILQIQPLLK